MARTPKPPINYTTGLAGNVKTLYLDLYRLLSLFLFSQWVCWRSWKRNTRLFSLSAWARVVSCSSAQYSSTLWMSLFGICFPRFRLDFRCVSPTLSASHIEVWHTDYSRAWCLMFQHWQQCKSPPPAPSTPSMIFKINLLWIHSNAVHFNNISDGMHAVPSCVNGCISNGSTLYCC